MRKKLTAVLALSALMVTCLASTALAYNKQNIGVVVDGRHMSFTDAKPFIDGNNRTMIPLRVVSEYMDCKVDWNETTQVITIDNNVKKAQYQFTIGNKSYSNDGQSVSMDTAPVMKDNRTFVPVRYIGELFGKVEWKDYTVFIATNEEYQPGWRNDKALQAKLAEGKTVKLADVMTGTLGGNTASIETLKMQEKEGGLTIKQYDYDPFGCYYTEMDKDGIKPFVQTPIVGEKFYAYCIKGGLSYNVSDITNRVDGTMGYIEHYPSIYPSLADGYDYMALKVHNPDGNSSSMYVFPLTVTPNK